MIQIIPIIVLQLLGGKTDPGHFISIVIRSLKSVPVVDVKRRVWMSKRISAKNTTSGIGCKIPGPISCYGDGISAQRYLVKYPPDGEVECLWGLGLHRRPAYKGSTGGGYLRHSERLLTVVCSGREDELEALSKTLRDELFEDFYCW